MTKQKTIKQIQTKQNSILTYFDNLSNAKIFLIVAAVFAIIAVVQCYACLRGAYTSDEAFYLTIPYRVLMGDKLFVDEWHVAQTSSFVQIPLVWIFVKIKGSTEGIILFSRHIFILINFAFIFFAFFKLKKFGTIPALISCMLAQISIPELGFSWDYYTISLVFFELSILVLFTSEKLNKLKIILAGFLFALAVTGEPTLAFAYFVYTIAIIILNIIKKANYEPLKIKFWGLFTAGIAIAGVLFLAYILSQETLTEFITSIPNIFRSGEYGVNTFFAYSSFFKKFLPVACVPLILNLVWIISFIFIRKMNDGYRYCFVLALIILIISIALFVTTYRDDFVYYCYFQAYFTFFAFECYLLTKNKNKRYIPFFISSLIYFACIGLVSEANNGIGTIGLVFVLLIFGPAVFDAAKEIYKKKDKLNNIITVSLSVIIISFVCIYCAFIYNIYNNVIIATNQGSTTNEKVEIDYGPYKGIMCFKEQKDIYDRISSDIETLEELSDGNYTIASQCSTWCSLTENHGLKTFTTWHEDSKIETYTDYFKNYGLPEYVYIPDTDFLTMGSTYNENDLPYFRSVLDTETIDAECGVILKVNGWKQ